MPDDPRPPVAIRISRPYATEDEFLEQELETLTRTSVTLLGAQPRPQGVVLRFELVLSSGVVVLRGEGRVVGFKPNAHHGLGGLTLRFTRLDSKSKALVDKVAALRERRRPSALPGVPVSTAGSTSTSSSTTSAPPPSPSPEPPPVALPKPPPLPARASAPPGRPSAPLAREPGPVVAAAQQPPPNIDLESTHGEAPRATKSVPPPSSRQASAPPDRDALLDRLRTRAKTLDGVAVQRILASRRRAGAP